MTTYPTPYGLELIVLEEGEPRCPNCKLEGNQAIPCQWCDKHTPLDQLTEQQARELELIPPDAKIDTTAKTVLTWKIAKLLQSEGKTLRVGERPQMSKPGVAITKERLAWEIAIPQDRILLKLK